MYSWIALVPCPIPIIFNSLGNRRECRFRHPLLHHQIRQVGAHLPLLRGGVLLQVVGHGDVQQGIVLCLLPPSVAGAEVGEGDDLATEEDFHAVVELAESAGGEPEEFRKDCGADDRSLFGFYQGDGELRAEWEQVLSEQALGQRPILWQLMQCFQPAVHPHCRRNGAVLDAVAGPGIVGDDLPCAAPVPDVELVENGISVLCRPDKIFLHERLCGLLAEHIGKKGDKSVLWREQQRFPDNFHREQTQSLPRFLAAPDGPFPGFGQGGNLSALPIRHVRGIEIVAATLLVVATAIAFYIHRDVVFVHVGREAVGPSAVRAAESAVPVLILQQVVTVVLLHIVSGLCPTVPSVPFVPHPGHLGHLGQLGQSFPLAIC